MSERAARRSTASKHGRDRERRDPLDGDGEGDRRADASGRGLEHGRGAHDAGRRGREAQDGESAGLARGNEAQARRARRQDGVDQGARREHQGRRVEDRPQQRHEAGRREIDLLHDAGEHSGRHIRQSDAGRREQRRTDRHAERRRLAARLRPPHQPADEAPPGQRDQEGEQGREGELELAFDAERIGEAAEPIAERVQELRRRARRRGYHRAEERRRDDARRAFEDAVGEQRAPPVRDAGRELSGLHLQRVRRIEEADRRVSRRDQGFANARHIGRVGGGRGAVLPLRGELRDPLVQVVDPGGDAGDEGRELLADGLEPVAQSRQSAIVERPAVEGLLDAVELALDGVELGLLLGDLRVDRGAARRRGRLGLLLGHRDDRTGR